MNRFVLACLVACGGGGESAAVAPPTPSASVPPPAATPDAAAPPVLRAEVEPGEANAGGAATSFTDGARAFLQPLPHLTGALRTAYFAGQAMFEVNWTPPAATPSDRAGLGPTYVSTSCQACHFANGRGAPPLESGDAMISSLLRVSIDGTDEHGGPAPHPVYGDQIQPRAIPGASSEGAVRALYTLVGGRHGDGTAYDLLRPSIVFEPALGDPGPGLHVSARVASATIGMGLLAAVPEAAILAHADPDDANGDGISGRANRVWSVATATHALGRFGWKANQPTLDQQNAAAFLGDIGITSTLLPTENCPPSQPTCTPGSGPELEAARLEATTIFMRATAVPGRRLVDDPGVLRGKHLFRELGCSSCHVPRLRTGVVLDLPDLSEQDIWPYTDLLLHDMGEDLADDRPDFEATGREWRTPPLWGLGLQATVSGHERLLHDGRARGPAEAILWHGGEAQRSAEGYRALPAEDREALVRFLRSL